jgi:RNA polymerase sigma-70 factor (ECF subfamily)
MSEAGRQLPLPSSPPAERQGADNLAESAFRRHYGQVYRFLRRRTGDPGRAEELTQTVFADAAAANHKLVDRPDRPVLAWLYTVAQRRLLDDASRRRDDAALADHDDLPAPPRGQPGLADALRAAIGRLPDGQRQVIVLKLLHGRSFAEIAELTGVGVDASKMRFSRGLARLRAELASEGIEP